MGELFCSIMGVSAFTLVVVSIALLLVRDFLSNRFSSDARKWDRWKRGLCVGCGYDLRSSPSVCPECGRMNQWADVDR